MGSGKSIYPLDRYPVLRAANSDRDQAIRRQTAVGTVIVDLSAKTPQELAELVSATTERFVDDAARAAGEPIRILAAAPAIIPTTGGGAALMIIYSFERLLP